MVWWRVVYKSLYNGGYDIWETMAYTIDEVIAKCNNDFISRIISITKASVE